jgi:HSP20 family protein
MVPKVDVSESDKEIQIVAELPGLKQEDVDLSLADDVLTIRGETRESREEREKQYHLTERSYGRFERSFQLPDFVDRERIAARFENGLLTVTLPKSEKARPSARRIEIARK